MAGLISIVRESFKQIAPTRELVSRDTTIPLVDNLMSGLAVFGLKLPALLEFDKFRANEVITHNLGTLYGVEQVPSDTCMRERLDEVDPRALRETSRTLFRCLQETKLLQEFEYIDGHYLVSGDGTGYFSSRTVHCENCCVKRPGQSTLKFLSKAPDELDDLTGKSTHYLLVKMPGNPWKLICKRKNENDEQISLTSIEGLQKCLGDKESKNLNTQEKAEIKALIVEYHRVKHPELALEYYHQMYCGAIVHPDKKTVIPFAPEPILKSDGSKKNDCERNASKRFYEDLRREHPQLKIIVIEDGLASNIPHLELLIYLHMRFIIGAKPGDHKALFDSVQQLIDKKSKALHEDVVTLEDGTICRYRYVNNIQLNESDPEFFVNFLEYVETKPGGKPQVFSWVTDLQLTPASVHRIMKAGRARWKIENETFNTLKTQGYHFGHNFGHGKLHLSSVFASLMMLAFTLDQICEAACQMFQGVRNKLKQRTYMWKRMQGFFMHFEINSWHDLYRALMGEHVKQGLIFSTA